jgi:hypothetical protein
MEFPAHFSFDGKTVSFEPTKSSWNSIVQIRSPWSTKLSIEYAGGQVSRHPFEIKPQLGDLALLHLLKSNLQKAIRRKEMNKAIRTAFAIYSFKPSELLRRLPMIMMEDALLYPSGYMRMVWWMCAVSKGYRMNQEEVESLMGIVSTMCESETYEVCQQREWKMIDWSSLPTEQRNFLWTMEIRRMYGGMKVDQHMISFHQYLWFERLTSSRKDEWWNMLNRQDEYRIEIESIEPISKDDILLESIDYHCFPWIPRKLQETYSSFTEDEIRLAIWLCRSRTNFRKPQTEDSFRPTGKRIAEIGNVMEKQIKSLSEWILRKIHFGGI